MMTRARSSAYSALGVPCWGPGRRSLTGPALSPALCPFFPGPAFSLRPHRRNVLLDKGCPVRGTVPCPSPCLVRSRCPMAVSIFASQDIAIFHFWGQDLLSQDLLNVQLYQYQSGLTPNPSGISVIDGAAAGFTQWSGFWGPFQCSEFRWKKATCQRIKSVSGILPNKWKAVLWDQWTVFGDVPGSTGGEMLPAFAAYSVQKVSSSPGRGRQGHVRISGVSEGASDDGILTSINLAALNLSLAAPGALNISVGAPTFTDMFLPVTLNGKLINTAPGHAPVFYANTVDGFICHPLVGSQITRKAGRRRSHH